MPEINPFCNKCNNTGLIPFKNKAGKLIDHAFIYCECHNEPAHDYPALSPSALDFPVSYSFYRSLCQEYGWPDPGTLSPLEIEPKPQVIEHIHRHSGMGRREFDLLQQTVLKAEYLAQKLTEHIEASKKRKGKY